MRAPVVAHGPSTWGVWLLTTFAAFGGYDTSCEDAECNGAVDPSGVAASPEGGCSRRMDGRSPIGLGALVAAFQLAWLG